MYWCTRARTANSNMYMFRLDVLVATGCNSQPCRVVGAFGELPSGRAGAGSDRAVLVNMYHAGESAHLVKKTLTLATVEARLSTACTASLSFFSASTERR